MRWNIQHLWQLMAATAALRILFPLSLAYLSPFQPQIFAQGAGSYPLTYSGRVTSQSGAPLQGSTNIAATFWDADYGGNQRGETFTFTGVLLSEGIFTIYFPFTGQQVEDIFSDGTAPVFIEINADGKTYPRQKFNYVPLAMRVPVNNKNLVFDETTGKLGIKDSATAASGSVLVSDGNGGVKWDSLSANNFTAKTLTNTAPSQNQVLTYQNGKWVAATPTATATTSGNYLTDLVGDVTASGPGTGTATLTAVAIPGTAAKITFDAKGRVLSGTTLDSTDITGALGFTPVSGLSITTGTGLSGGQITNNGTISLANTTVAAGAYSRANIVVDPQGRITSAENSAAIADADIAPTANIAQSKIAGLSTSLTGKEDLITPGTANEYYRGDKTWQTLNTAVVPESGSALYFSDVRARASLTGMAPINFSNTTGVISMAKADGSTNGYLSSADWTTFTAKQNALGFSPVNKAGDTMSGSLNMGNQDIADVGNLTMAQAKTFGLGVFDNSAESTMIAGLDNSGANSQDKGKTWFNKDSSQVKYWDGTSAKALGISGAGLTSLNGLTTSTQTFSTGTTGNSPAVVSSGSVHTIHIPMASAGAGVTAGLVSNAEYASLNAKISGVTGTSPIAVSTASGTATVSLNNTTVTPGTYTRATVAVDQQGRLTAASNGGNVNLATEVTSILAIANGGTGADLSATGGAGQYLKQSTAGGPVTVGSLASADITGALGFTPVNTAGDSLSGNLNLGSNKILGLGTPASPTDAANKSYVDGSLGGSQFDQTAKINDYVIKWNQTSSKYYLAADQTGTAGGGITSINGLSAGSQTLAVGNSGTSPSFSSSTSTHTLNLPMASAASVTAGLISNTDYTAFNSKQPPGNYITTMGGDVTVSGFGSGSVTASLASISIAGTSTKVTYDVKGRVLSGTSLTAADIPPISAGIITSGTLGVANGGTGATSLAANNVILGNGTNPVQVVAPGTSGNVLTSNGTTWQSTALPWATPGTIGSTTPSTGAFTSITSNAQAGYEAKPFGAVAGNTSEVRFDELAANGTNYVGFKSPDLLAANKIWVLPAADGTAGQVLKTDGAGNLGWVSAATGSVTSVGITAPAAGITVTGGPITSSGSMTLALSNDLAALEGLSTTGGVERTGADTWATYTLTAAGKALLDDADVTAQRTTLGLGTLATASTVSGGSGGTIADATIVNADIATTAAIATSKLSGPVTAITGNGLGTLATASAVSGGVGGTITDGTITNDDISASAAITDTKLATISTAGKVSGTAITSGNITTTGAIASSAQSAFEAKPFGTVAGNTSEVRFDELAANGTNYVGFKSPDLIAANKIWVLPNADGTAGQVLKTDGAGNLGWVSAASGSVTNVTGTAPISVVTGTSTPVISISQANATTSGFLSSTDWSAFNSKQPSGSYITQLSGDVTLSGFTSGTATASLASVAIAGTSTKVTYDVKGRVTAGTSLIAADLPPHSAALITSGTLGVANGGTGATSLAANNVILGNGTNPVQVVAPGTSGNVLTSNGTTWQSTALPWATPGTIGSTTPSTGAFTSITSNAQAGYEAKPFGATAGNTGEIRFDELAANGTNYVGFKSPDLLAANKIWVLPATDGTAGQVLKTDGAGNLGWISAATGSVTSVGITAPAAGITVTGGPITSSGSMTLALSNDLAAVEGLSSTGGVERTGADTWATYTLTAAGKALLDDADATAQRTTLGLGTLATASTVASAQITDGSVVNADIATTAAIATSKLSGAVTSITGHGLGTLATASAVSGGTGGTITDGTITNADISTTAAIADSKLTTISTAGKVSGSAITAGNITTTGAIASSAQSAFEAKPFGTAAGNTSELRFDELAANGTNYVGFKAPDLLAANKVWVLPNADGTAGQVLKTDGVGNLGWVSAAGGTVTSVGITAPAAGITVTGGPITSSGSMTLALSNDLAAVEGLSTTGLAKRTGADTWSTVADNSTNWDVAYTDRLKWDGSATGLIAATGRTSLGLGSLATLSAVASAQITDGSVVNADIATTAAIATSKLSGAVTSITGHGLGTLATASAVSGGTGGTITDGTITNADISTTAAIADSKLTTISTAGKVSGSAITAGNITTTGAIASSAQGAFEAKPFGIAAGNTSEVRFDELAANGTNYVGFKAPDLLAANKVWVLPNADGTSGQVLKTDGAGNLGWVSAAGGSVTSVGITAPAAGITVSGSPITSSGSMTLALSNDLAAVEGLSTTGGVERTGADNWATYTLTAAGKALLDDADATAQRTTLGLGSLATASTVASAQITDATIVNADIATAAAIATSKLAGPVTAITGNGLGTLATASAVAGGVGGTITDGTISNADIATTAAIADSKLATISTAGKVSGAAVTSGTIGGSTAITTSGDITTTGRVGIGTTAPAGLLNVVGTGGVFLNAGNVGIGVTSSPAQLSLAGGDGTNLFTRGTITLGYGSNGSFPHTIHTRHQNSGSGNAIDFYTNDGSNNSYPSGSVHNLSMVNGNVGIGTTAPANKLEVNGSADFTGSVGIGTTTPGYNLGVASSGTWSTSVGIVNSSGSGHTYSIESTGSAHPYGAGKLLVYDGTGGPRMIIDSAGNVGIGTTSPNTRLHIAADAANVSGSMGQLLVTGASNNAQQLILGYDTTNDYGSIQSLKQNVSYKPLALQPAGGNVGIGTTNPTIPLDVQAKASYTPPNAYGYLYTGGASTYPAVASNYSIRASGDIVGVTIVAISDRREKENIVDISYEQAQSFLENLRPVHFSWKDRPDNQSYGFIAQELMKNGYKELVSFTPKESMPETIDDDGFVSPKGYQFNVNYDALTPILTKIVQLQGKEITNLKSENIKIKGFLCEKFPEADICK